MGTCSPTRASSSSSFATRAARERSSNTLCTTLMATTAPFMADMSINVADGSYQSTTAYALLMLLVWPFGVPIGVATLLWRHRAPLLELRCRDRLSKLPFDTGRASVADLFGATPEAHEATLKARG